MENPARDPLIKAWVIMHMHRGGQIKGAQGTLTLLFSNFSVFDFQPSQRSFNAFF